MQILIEQIIKRLRLDFNWHQVQNLIHTARILFQDKGGGDVNAKKCPTGGGAVPICPKFFFFSESIS